MIIVRLDGGLGNQLFQYAAGRRLAHKWQTDLKLDLSIVGHPFHPARHDHYRLKDFNIIENFATPEEVEHIKNLHKGTSLGIEKKSAVDEILNYPDNVYLQGFWGKEKYFAEIADILRREFTLKKPLGAVAQHWKKKILSAECSVAVHIRHGDYLLSGHIESFGILPFEYYRNCVAELKKSFPNITVFVFAENFTLVKKFLSLDVPTEFVESCRSDLDEFYLMSLCKHTVIANSTFSWWAAWLNQNPDKKIFFPDPWTPKGYNREGLPADWIKIPVEHGNLLGGNRSMLSIIVYIKNNLQTLTLLLSGIFAQTFKDYQLILINDGSNDGSENLCRQIAPNKKIAIIHSGGGVDKATAWNRGLDYARGEYVLFLSGDDLIFPNTVQSLFHACSIRDANIVCGVQYLQENPLGNVNIDGIAGKKFFHCVDEKFKTLNSMLDLKEKNLYQKLIMLGMKNLNTLLGTKFFRREFLIKNSIRFNENIAEDFEVLFQVNAIMASNEIIFTPNLFYIAPRRQVLL